MGDDDRRRRECPDPVEAGKHPFGAGLRAALEGDGCGHVSSFEAISAAAAYETGLLVGRVWRSRSARPADGPRGFTRKE